MYFDFCNKKIVDFETFLFVFDTKKNEMMIYDHAPFGGTIGGALRRHGMPISYKKIYS